MVSNNLLTKDHGITLSFFGTSLKYNSSAFALSLFLKYGTNTTVNNENNISFLDNLDLEGSLAHTL